MKSLYYISLRGSIKDSPALLMNSNNPHITLFSIHTHHLHADTFQKEHQIAVLNLELPAYVTMVQCKPL